MELFGDLFDEDQPLFESSTKVNRALNCASSLQIPDPPRSSSNFVGLFNQGGTCYMNSSLQILFMTQEFRNILYSLPLCQENLSTPSSFIPQNQKYNILLSLQTLFAELNNLNVNAVKTNKLTEAFNWNSGEGSDQQDSQEFIRLLLFDVLERILFGTQYTDIVNSLYKIGYVSKMKCSNCSATKSKFESEFVLPLQVFGIQSLGESLSSMFGLEEVIEGYKCENCNQTVNLIKSNKINSLPKYINIGLNRFTYDFETGERIKITSKFEFPLEIDMKNYCDIEGKKDDDFIYELYGIIIHSGTPYSGHYFSYIRDMTNQGNWNLQPLEKFSDKPIEVVETKEKKEEVPQKGKKGKKNKKKKKEEDEEDKENKLNYDQCDFPIPYEDKSLAEKWFEFNDTVITPIRIGKLQKVFKTKTSAYMLFYVQKSEKKSEIIPPPEYLKKYTDELNESLEKQRLEYEKEKNSLIYYVYQEEDFQLIEDKFIRIEKEAPKKKEEKKTQFTNTVSTLFSSLQNNKKEIYIFDYDPRSFLITLLKKITFDMSEIKVSEVGMYHQCNIVFVSKESKTFKDVKIGQEYEPTCLKFYFNGTKFDFITYSNEPFNVLKENLEKKIGSDKISLSFQTSNGKEVILDENTAMDKKEKKFKTVKELNLKGKPLLSITTETQSKTNLSSESSTDEINCLVRHEENDEDVKIISIKLSETFGVLVKKIEEEFNLTSSSFRCRLESSNKIISKSQYNEQVKKNPLFCEGDVRIKVENGEPYSENEILLLVLTKDSKNVQVIKEFIGNPEKVKINQLKKILIENLNKENNEKENGNYTPLTPSDYLLYKVDMFLDPIKQIKNEEQTLEEVGLKDKNYLCLRLAKEITSDTAFIEVFKCEENYYDTTENFLPINVEQTPFSTITVLKKTKISEIKQMINKDIAPDKIRLRVIGKYNQPERLLKDQFQLKKYNVESPVKILYEELKEKESLSENELLLTLMLRNDEKKYYNKSVIKAKFEKGMLSTDLYSICREYSKWEKIVIAKHIRGMYTWEKINELDEKGKPINLKKGSIALRDSDWIGIKKLEEGKDNDEFETEFDIKNKQSAGYSNWAKGKKTKKKIVEKPLRIEIED